MTIVSSINGVNIQVRINDNFVTSQSGFLGVLIPGTKITITVEVVGDVNHECYVLSYNDSMITRTPKATSKSGAYTKNMTVIGKRTVAGTVTTQVAGFPANLIGLDINGKSWNIGVVSQNGRYYFAIEEWLPTIEDNELLPFGMVLGSSFLHGLAMIKVGKGIFGARLHWTNMPWRKDIGFRLLEQGEVINYNTTDIVELDGASSFRYEIKHCTLA